MGGRSEVKEEKKVKWDFREIEKEEEENERKRKLQSNKENAQPKPKKSCLKSPKPKSFKPQNPLKPTPKMLKSHSIGQNMTVYKLKTPKLPKSPINFYESLPKKTQRLYENAIDNQIYLSPTTKPPIPLKAEKVIPNGKDLMITYKFPLSPPNPLPLQIPVQIYAENSK